MAEAPKTPEAHRATDASGDVRASRRPGLRKQFGEKATAMWGLGVRGVQKAEETVTAWGTALRDGSKKVLEGKNGKALKELGGGIAKLAIPLALLIALGYVSVMTGGSWWGPPGALAAALYGIPMFGRVLGVGFATTNKQPNAGFWAAVGRHFKKERIEMGPFVTEEKVVVKEKPQQGGAAGQAPGQQPGA